VRLLGQLKFGFFPAAPAAVRALATHLSLAGDPARTAILDPCAGEGEALALVAAALGVDGPRVHAIELDDGRADAVRARLPGARVLGPCSFLAAAVGRGFGLAYCNPPFDDELGGGGREELAFLSASTGVLVPGGVLALVVPRRTAEGWKLHEALDCWYDGLRLFRFPAGSRPFDEHCILGYRRALPLPPREAPRVARDWFGWQAPPAPDLGAGGDAWRVPESGPGPRLWAKRDLTAAELLAALAASPLHRRLLAPARPRRKPRPPLPPGDGHLAMLIASGHLDGVIRAPGEPPHVVRGTSRKEKWLAGQEQTTDAKGSKVTVEDWQERVVNLVRTAEQDGTLRTFEQ
jgi:hypothetical protein